MLRIQHVSKTFNAGTITEKKALHDVCLDLAPGDFVTVIGGNGAGKSTLLNLIAGVYTADEGTIVLDGRDISALKEYERAAFFGRVFQDPMRGTAATMQIEENLALAYRRGKRRTLRWGISAAERRLYREKLAVLGLGLENRMSAKVGLLSGGQRQALTLLMATLQKPRLLLLDEHTAALDPKTAQKVLDLTEEIIHRDKLTAFMVTHNMKNAIRYGNRLIMMHEGRIIYDVSGEEKKNIQVADLLKKFENSDGTLNDRMLLGVRLFYYSVTAFSHHFSLTLQLLSGLFAAVYADGVFWITNETKQKNKDEKAFSCGHCFRGQPVCTGAERAIALRFRTSERQSLHTTQTNDNRGDVQTRQMG